MNYLKFPLGVQQASSLVEVTLKGVESDVFLVDDQNLTIFEQAGRFRYVGGHYKQSPVRLRIPSATSWTLIVIPGTGGEVSASVKVIKGR